MFLPLCPNAKMGYIFDMYSYLLKYYLKKKYPEHEVFIYLLIFKIHQAGQTEHPSGPVLAHKPYVWLPCC